MWPAWLFRGVPQVVAQAWLLGYRPVTRLMAAAQQSQAIALPSDRPMMIRNIVGVVILAGSHAYWVDASVDITEIRLITQGAARSLLVLLASVLPACAVLVLLAWKRRGDMTRELLPSVKAVAAATVVLVAWLCWLGVGLSLGAVSPPEDNLAIEVGWMGLHVLLIVATVPLFGGAYAAVRNARRHKFRIGESAAALPSLVVAGGAAFALAMAILETSTGELSPELPPWVGLCLGFGAPLLVLLLAGNDLRYLKQHGGITSSRAELALSSVSPARALG